MKRLIFLFVLASFMFSCKDISDKGNEYTSAYVCPMHCKGSGSDKPGVCPVCEMDYVLNKEDDHGHEGHNHDGHDHEGHNHDHDGDDHNHGNESDTTHQH